MFPRHKLLGPTLHGKTSQRIFARQPSKAKLGVKSKERSLYVNKI